MWRNLANLVFTPDELLSYFEKNPNAVFDMKENGDSIVVKSDGECVFFEEDDDEYDATEGLVKTKLKVCHTLLNANRSYITTENMKKAMPSLANRPILGNVIQLDDGTYDFHSHDVEVDEDGNVTNIQRAIGVIPESNNAKLEYDTKMKKNYVVVDGWVYEGYSNKGLEILKKKKKCKVSCELGVNDISYNAKEKRIDINDFYFRGVTILGSEKDGTPIQEGMKGSNITLCNSESSDTYEEVLNLLKEMNTTISNHFNANGEGGNGVSDVIKNAEGNTDDVKDTDDLTIVNSEDNTQTDDDNQPEVNTDDVVKYSVEFEGKSLNFEVSMNDKIRSLSRLVSKEYEDDGVWYDVIAYENYLVMTNSYRGKHYKQDYKYENDAYSLVGDRVKVTPTFVTDAEQVAIDEMRANYDVTLNELNTYKEKEEKENKEKLFNSDDYSKIKDTEEFKELKENMDKYSLDECAKKSDEILLTYVKSNKLSFVEETKDTVDGKVSKKQVSFSKVDDSKKDEYKPYGDLFDEIDKSK